MSKYFVMGGQTYTLQSSISSTQTTITLTSFKVPVSLADITMALMNTDIAYATIAPRTSQSEFISFTGITQNVDGTATLTGVVRGLNKTYPYTESSTFKLPHAGATQFILSDPPQLFNQYSVIANDETITGRKVFPASGTASTPIVGVTYAAPVQDTEIATKKYVDTVAIAGAPDASTTTKGIVKMSVAPVSATSPIAVGDNDTRVPTANQTAALVGNNTDIAVGSGNKFVTQTGFQNGAEIYAADSGSTDAYAITLSPVPTSYHTGMVIRFKANTANTSACTLNVNSLGAKTIKKELNVDLCTGDILANQLISVIYDGTNFQILSPIPEKTYNGVLTINSTTTTTITCGFRPKLIRISAINGTSNYGVSISNGSYSVAQGTNRCMLATYASSGNVFSAGTDTSNCLSLAYNTGTTTISAYINNITATGFDIVSTASGGTAQCSYEVIG